jgi:tetratricopeptide (TPR) repeat protein
VRKFIIFTLGVLLGIGMTACRSERPGTQQNSQSQTNALLEQELDGINTNAERVTADVGRLVDQGLPPAKTLEEQKAARMELARKVQERYAPVREAYETFIKRHPKYANGYAAYGDFLLSHHDEDGATEQLETALKLDKTNPMVYNDLANIYGHTGPVKKAFDFYDRAIKLDSTEPVYYHNFGTTVFLFRKDAKEFYGINEQQVFDKALALYSNAMRLDPTNFALASDVAESYYGIKPWRFDAALQAWTNTLALAHDESDRQSVYTHFARIKTQAGMFDEARAHLEAVTNADYAKLKDRMLRNIQEHEAAARTNAPSAKQARDF